MEKKNGRGCRNCVIGAFFIVCALVLFVLGAVFGFDGPFYLMYVAIPFFIVGFILIMGQCSKKLLEKQKAKSIALLKELKGELADREELQDQIVCPSCGVENETDGKFCKQCGKPLYRVCPFCGARLSDDDKFCNQCGKEIIDL